MLLGSLHLHCYTKFATSPPLPLQAIHLWTKLVLTWVYQIKHEKTHNSTLFGPFSSATWSKIKTHGLETTSCLSQTKDSIVSVALRGVCFISQYWRCTSQPFCLSNQHNSWSRGCTVLTTGRTVNVKDQHLAQSLL